MLADPGELTGNLFAIRAASLLQGLDADRASATLSGLLIGSEIGSARKSFASERLTLVRSGRLGRLYEAALGIAGYAVSPVDAEETVKAGLAAAAKAIWPKGDLR